MIKKYYSWYSFMPISEVILKCTNESIITIYKLFIKMTK